MSRLEIAKKIIKENIKYAKFGIYPNRNTANDVMVNIYAENGVYIDICYDYKYFEVFGLTKEEFNGLRIYYLELCVNSCIECSYALLDRGFVAGCKKNKSPENCEK